MQTWQIKDRLTDYMDIDRDIDLQIERLEYMEAKLCAVKGPVYSDMPKGTGSSDKMTNLLAKKLELEERIKSLIEERAEVSKAIEWAISGLTADEKAVVRCRYIDGLKWDDITIMVCGSSPESIDSDRRHIFKVHGRALEKITKNVNKSADRYKKTRQNTHETEYFFWFGVTDCQR